MPQHFAYNQDFYVDSDSFAEEEAKVEGRVVVFQILEQRKGREKAVGAIGFSRRAMDGLSPGDECPVSHRGLPGDLRPPAQRLCRTVSAERR